MAFVQTTNGLNKLFQKKANVQICRRQKAPCMELRPEVIEKGLKTLMVSGALLLTSTFAIPSESTAAFLKFPGETPKNIGLRYGRYLDNCPPTKNCVSSSANVYDSHFVPAWTYDAVSGKEKKTMKEAVTDITQVLKDYPRTTIIESKPTTSEVGDGYYIYAECESKLLGFVDDVEFFFQPDNTTVEYRSASRLGESDLDVNRKRIRDFRVALQEKVLLKNTFLSPPLRSGSTE